MNRKFENRKSSVDFELSHNGRRFTVNIALISISDRKGVALYISRPHMTAVHR